MLINDHARNLAVLNSDDSVSHLRKSGIVRNYYNCHSLLGTERLQKLKYRFTRLIIKRARRLVAQKKLRILGDCSCN